MKFKLSTVVLFIIIFSANAQKKEYSSWSLSPSFGYNIFDGDINQSTLNLIPTAIIDLTGGLSVEYALDPIWGISADGMFIPLRAKTNIPFGISNNVSPVNVTVKTNLLLGSINGTVNLTRLIYPKAAYKLHLNVALGAGYSYYTFENSYTSTGKPIGDNDSYEYVPLQISKSGKPIKSAQAINFPVTFSAEYNFSKSFAFGGKAQYIAHTKDNLEGLSHLIYQGVTNDYVATALVYVRYKINAENKKHKRNISYEEFSPNRDKELAKVVEKLANDLDSLKRRVDTLEFEMDSIMPKVAWHDQILSRDGEDSDGDGVPDIRDFSPDSPKDTDVDFWGKPLRGNNGKSKDRISSVYFDTDKIDLDDKALETIHEIAMMLKSNEAMTIEIRGYADYEGNDNYNYSLSERRAERVKKELVEVWKIASSRLSSNGKGKISFPNMSYRPNRKCDFFINK